MKIALVGGGTGGHFYPLIAVAEGIEDICAEERLLLPEMIYIGHSPFDAAALLEHDIGHKKSPAGRMRRYGSISNIFDSVKTALVIIRSIPLLYRIYPDVIFSTGGFASLPTL